VLHPEDSHRQRHISLALCGWALYNAFTIIMLEHTRVNPSRVQLPLSCWYLDENCRHSHGERFEGRNCNNNKIVRTISRCKFGNVILRFQVFGRALTVILFVLFVTVRLMVSNIHWNMNNMFFASSLRLQDTPRPKQFKLSTYTMA
jgi:hypothetical protein